MRMLGNEQDRGYITETYLKASKTCPVEQVPQKHWFSASLQRSLDDPPQRKAIQSCRHDTADSDENAPVKSLMCCLPEEVLASRNTAHDGSSGGILSPRYEWSFIAEVRIFRRNRGNP